MRKRKKGNRPLCHRCVACQRRSRGRSDRRQSTGKRARLDERLCTRVRTRSMVLSPRHLRLLCHEHQWRQHSSLHPKDRHQPQQSLQNLPSSTYVCDKGSRSCEFLHRSLPLSLPPSLLPTMSSAGGGGRGVQVMLFFFFFFQFKGNEGIKRGGETSMCERNIHQFPLTCSHLGTHPTTQACALTGNQTGTLSVHRPALDPQSHTSQGRLFFCLNLSSLNIGR